MSHLKPKVLEAFDSPIDAWVGRPCSLEASAWHRQELQRLIQSDLSTPHQLARRDYHRRWVEHLQRPGDSQALPKVSVVIPVFNRARMAAEAVAGALAQSHSQVEVIVVDDGSSDDLTSALLPFLPRITLLHQPNRGVASARNRGLQAATGDFILFLDSDDLLECGAIEALLTGFRAVPDAELCYAAPHQRNLGGDLDPFAGLGPRPAYLDPLRGDLDCSSRDLMEAVCRIHPFLLLGTLMPRWLILELGGFDERLRRGEDTRLLFQLGIRGTKVIGLRRRLSFKRLLSGGLSTTQTAAGYASTRLINLVDLLGRPELWPHVPKLLHSLSDPMLWPPLEESEPVALIAEYRTALLKRLGALPSEPSPYSPTPVLLAFHQLAAASHARCSGTATRALFARRLRLLCALLLRRSPPPTEADLRLWLPTLPASPASPLCLLTLSLIEQGQWWNGSSPPERFWRDLDQAIAALPPSSPGLRPVRAYRDGLWNSCRQRGASSARMAHDAAWLLALLSGQPGPLVSIVIPVCDGAESVTDSVASCLGQTYGRTEVLVIDDGARAELLEALRPCLARVRLLRQPKQGAAAARELGLRAARGALVLVVEPDERLAAGAIEAAVAAARSCQQPRREKQGEGWLFLSATKREAP